MLFDNGEKVVKTGTFLHDDTVLFEQIDSTVSCVLRPSLLQTNVQ